MNLWFRLVWLLLTFRWRPRLQPPLGISRINSRVWPLDLDLNGHLNNGRALTLMDVGRIDLVARNGLLKVMLRKGWMPILSCAATRYRREMPCFRPFVIQSRVLCWEGTIFVMEHSLIQTNADNGEDVACVALNRAGLYDRRRKRFVPVEEICQALGIDPVSPAPPEDVQAFLALSEALKART